MAVVLHEYKGFCLDYNRKTDVHKQIVTTGIDNLPTFSTIDGTDDKENDVFEDAPTQMDPKIDPKIDTDPDPETGKKNKQQKRLEKQQKKIRVSQRKLKQKLHLNQGKNETDETRVSQAVIRNNIKEIYSQISNTTTNTTTNPTKTTTKTTTKANEETKLFQYESVALYTTDLDQVLPGEWINDNIISLIYEYMNNDILHQYKKYVKLISPVVVQLISFTDSNILDNKEFLAAKFILLPVNETQEGDHWFLVLINVLENEVLVYDSMVDEGEDNRKLIDNLITKLTKNKVISPSKLMVKYMKIEQQSNFDDCGVYLIMISCFLVNMLVNGDINFDLSNLKFNPFKGRLDILKVIKYLGGSRGQQIRERV